MPALAIRPLASLSGVVTPTPPHHLMLEPEKRLPAYPTLNLEKTNKNKGENANAVNEGM